MPVLARSVSTAFLSTMAAPPEESMFFAALGSSCVADDHLDRFGVIR